MKACLQKLSESFSKDTELKDTETTTTLLKPNVALLGPTT